MSSTDSVSQNTQDSFSSFRISFAQGQSLVTTGNATTTLPILNGGIQGGQYIIRRITIANPSNIAGGAVMNVAAANVTILTSNDGNTANSVTTNVGQTLANISGANTWQDLTLVAATASTAYTANALFVKVGVGVTNAAVNISVFGDVISF